MPLSVIYALKHALKNFRQSSALPISLAFGSGVCMALAPAPLNAFPCAWIALAPLWVLALSPPFPHSRLLSPASALAWGLAYHGLSLSWITGLHPLTWMGIPWLASVAIALFCWVFITLWGTIPVIVWTWLMGRIAAGHIATGQRNTSSPLPLVPLTRVLLGTAFWCGLEWIRNQGPLDWTALAYTQSPGNLAILHLGQLSGSTMVTAAIVAVNGLLAEAWIAWRKEEGETGRRGDEERRNARFNLRSANRVSGYLLLSAVGLLLGLHLVGFWLYSQPLAQPEGMALKIGIVQGNVPTRIKLFSTGLRRAEEGYTQGYEALVGQGVDAVLTPEGALPFLWDGKASARSPFYQAVLRQQVVAWLGTFTAQEGGIARSLLTIAGNGETLSRYDKVKLVPLGEYVPFQNILGGIIGRLTTIDEDGVPGRLEQRLNTPFGQAIASICYDSAFPEVFRAQAAAGGQFILTASNLDPYSEVLMAQHQAQDLMRAIETDRWAVRATNTGYSGVIDPHGRILWRSQPHTYQAHAATIFRRQTQTLYVRWGDWLTPFLLALGGSLWLIQRIPNWP